MKTLSKATTKEHITETMSKFFQLADDANLSSTSVAMLLGISPAMLFRMKRGQGSVTAVQYELARRYIPVMEEAFESGQFPLKSRRCQNQESALEE